MIKHTNISRELIDTAKQQQHFGIRKLTIGVTSVLLGTTLWLGGKANVAHADVGNDNSGASHQETQSNQPTSRITENTKVEVQADTPSESKQKENNVNNGQSPAENTLQTTFINRASLGSIGEQGLEEEKVSNAAGQKDLDEAAQEVAKARQEAARARAQAEPANPSGPGVSNPVNPSVPIPPESPTTPAPSTSVTATVNYFDQTTHQLLTKSQLQGKVGESIASSLNSGIKNLTNRGYLLVNPLPANTVLKDSGNNYQIDFVHGTETLSVENPGRPGQLINPNDPNGPTYPEGTGINDLRRIGMQIIHYTGAGTQTPSDNVKNFTFGRILTLDKVTGKITSSYPWNNSSYTFNSVNTPVVDGYHADRRNAGGLTVTPDNLRGEATVNYSPNGRIIPIDSFTRQPIAGAEQPTFQTDLQDATKVKAMSVPAIAGYIAQRPTVTPTDPSKNISVLYTKVNNSSVTIHLNDVDPNAWKDIIPVKQELAKVITIPGVAGRKIDFSTAQLPEGFEFAGSLPNSDFFGQTRNVTLNVKHRTQDVSLTDPAATKIVKETITVINSPNKAQLDLSQSIQLHRSVVYDQVTHLTTYGQWNTGHFNTVNIPEFSGYTASQTSIPAVSNVTVNYIDPHLKVAYTSDADPEGSAVVDFVDETGHIVGNDVVYGKKGSTSIVHAQVPDGCDIKTSSQRVTFSTSGHSSQVVNAEITPHISVISAADVKKASVWGTNRHASSDADVLPGTRAKHSKPDITYGDLNDQKTRTIIIIRPNNTIDPSSTVQRLYLQRSAKINALTGDVSYTDWVPDNIDKFSSVNIPRIAGYTASLIQVPASENIKGSYQDPHIVVTYKANPTKNHLVYQDDKGNVVGQQDIAGVTGQKVNLQLRVPDGYQVQEAPQQLTLQASDQPITVSVKPVTETFFPDQVTVSKPISAKTIITGTKAKHLKQGITFADLHRDVTRTINIIRPDGSLDPASTEQVVHFVRNAEVNAVSGDITYSQWEPINATTLASVDAPAVAGYTATRVPAITVNAANTDSTVTVSYVPQEETQTVVYRDENDNIVGQQTIKGKTGQTISPVWNVPDGYNIAANSQLPTNIIIKAQSKPLNVSVNYKVVYVKADDVSSGKPFSKDMIIPGTANKHVMQAISYNDLHKEVGRQILLTLPDGQQQTINQRVRFQREARIDAGTGKVSFVDWQVDGSDKLAGVKLQSISGYIPSSNVLEIADVDANESFAPLKITYLADTPTNRLLAADQNTKNQAQAKQRMEAKLAKLQQDQTANNDQSLSTKRAIEDQKKKVLQAQEKLQQDIKRENILRQDKKLRDKDDQAKKALQDIQNQIKDLKSQREVLLGQVNQQEQTEEVHKQAEKNAEAAYDQLNQKIKQLQATIDSSSAIAKLDLKLTPATIEDYDNKLANYKQVILDYEGKYDDTIKNDEKPSKAFKMILPQQLKVLLIICLKLYMIFILMINQI